MYLEGKVDSKSQRILNGEGADKSAKQTLPLFTRFSCNVPYLTFPQPHCPWRGSRCSHFGRGLAFAIHALLFRGSPSFQLDYQLRLTVRDSSQAAPSRLLPGEPLTGRSEPSGGSRRHSGTWPSTQALASDPRRHCRRADCPRRRCCPGRSDEDVQSQAPADLDEILFA